MGEGAPEAGPPLPSPGAPARLGFGAWAVGGSAWGPANPEGERLAALVRALDLGVTFFDTAPAYGESESLLGRALRGRRDSVLLATKVGPGESPRASLEASLRRLGTDRVDLLQLHEVGEGFERSLEEMDRLRREGKARALGLCNATPRQLARALEVAPLAAYQGPYSLVDRAAERRHLPLCRRRGLAFLAYRPLASGLLTGKFARPPAFAGRDHRGRIFWFRGRQFARRHAVVEALRPLARARETSLAALALAWALSRPGVSVVLAGARTPHQVEENVAAAALRLSGGELEAIEAAVAGAFRPPRAAPAALARDWGPRERFILERLDGRRSFEEIAAEWSEREEPPMVAAQVEVFADGLVEAGLAADDG